VAQQPLYKRSRRTRLLVVGLVTASLVMITADYRGGESGPLAAAGRATSAILTPLQRAMTNVLRPVGDFFSSISHLGSLRSENAALQLQLAELRARLGDTLSLQGRVEQLEKLLQITETLGDIPTRTGHLIGESVSNFEWAVTISLGSEEGVRVGMPVIAPDGLLGHVVKVTRDSSDVQLIIDPDSSVGGLIVGSREGGLLIGQRGDRDLRMDLVDPSTKVTLGDVVETSGFKFGNRGSLYPAHLRIGTVNQLHDDNSDLQKEIWVKPFVDFTRLQYVTVLLTSGT
jgi:rod shape-determining protein MreC